LLAARATKVDSGPPPIARRLDRGPCRLSPVQELLWLVNELDPEQSRVYNSSGATRLRGTLDVAALQRALTTIVQRHEALRTTFTATDGVPMQVVHEVDEMPVSVVDLSRLDVTERDEALDAEIRTQVRWTFDLAVPLLIRATLIKLADDEHVLVTVAHHIVWDGWSKGVFFNELTSCYEAYLRGAEPELDDVEIGYTDFAEWQRSWLDGGEQERQLVYWRQQLKGAPTLLALPTDHPRPPVQTFRGDRQSLWLTPELTGRINALARDRGSTLFMVLLSALDILLYRYSGQGDVCVGTPIAGRNRIELEKLIGYFTNTVVVRARCDDDPTFLGLLGRVRDAALGAYEHQDISFKQVVQELAPARDLSHSPIFQVMFVLQNATKDRMSLSGLTLERIEHKPEISKFDLGVGMGEHDGRLHASFEYSTDLFDHSTIDRMRDHFACLLQSIVDHPDLPISQLAMLDENEVEQQIEVWNATDAPLPSEPVHALIAAQAAANPTASAIVADDAVLTRGELAERVRAVGRALRATGLQPRSIVGVAAPRSAAFVTAVLGALDAGLAYVPLDPDYPAERLAFMLSDSGARVLLATKSVAALMADSVPAGVQVMLLDEIDVIDAGVQTPMNSEAVPFDRDAPVYVMYTSGSTGTPKGVVVTHKNLATHVAASIADYALTAADRVLQFASPSFDISVEEIFCALAAGATLVVRPAALDIAGQDWLDWLATQRVTVADLPTAYWHEWVHDMRVRGANPPTSLRLVIVGGEKAQPAVYTEWLALAGDRARWVNTYGPTEATVVATSYFPRAERAREDAIEMPIGRPVRNVRAYVLDRHLRPVPIGVVGDLYIGGSGVAKGYLGQPALTDARFLPSPFVAGDRLYRTGDLARALPDGTLLFAGRADEQVKLRGYRVEPGEVERVLGQHPGIAECAVVARTDSSGAMSLAAYVVPVHGASLAVAEIQAHLHERLPAYMVPAAVGVLHALPTSANGKIDLASLPMIEAEAHETVAPRNRTEEMLAGIWKEVLGHEVGVHDNFFEAAGHSLLAVRMFALLEREIQRRFPLATIVASPTIAELGGLIDGENRSTDGYRCLVPLQPRGRRVPLYVIHEVTGDVIGYRQLIAGLGSDQPVFGFESPAIKNEPPLDYRVEEISATYVAELRRFQPDGPYRLLGSCFGGVVAYEMARQLRAAGADVDLVVLINAVPYGYGERPPSALWRLVRRPTPAAARQYVRFRMLRLRRRVHRTLWWLQASQYVLGRRPLPSGLLEPITLHHVATQAYVALPYAGDLVHIISDDREPAPHDRRLLWTELAARVDEIRLTGPQFARPYFLTSSNVAIAGERLRERLDAMAAGL
jgi:amino acid adenylation domain-containing protein